MAFFDFSGGKLTWAAIHHLGELRPGTGAQGDNLLAVSLAAMLCFWWGLIEGCGFIRILRYRLRCGLNSETEAPRAFGAEAIPV